MANACPFWKKSADVYCTSEQAPYSVPNVIKIVLALTWSSSINIPTTIKNKVNYFGYITYTLDSWFLNAGIQKKHMYHLHTLSYSAFLVLITMHTILTARTLQSSVNHIRIWVPYTDFKELYTLATYCFSKHVLDQWIPSNMLFQACSLPTAFFSNLNRGWTR